MKNFPENVKVHWKSISPLLAIRNKREYNIAIKRLNELLDEIGINEKHPLYTLLDTLGTLVHAYEEEHYPIPEATGTDVLRFLMDEHGLTQSDLSEVGSQGVVSERLAMSSTVCDIVPRWVAATGRTWTPRRNRMLLGCGCVFLFCFGINQTYIVTPLLSNFDAPKPIEDDIL